MITVKLTIELVESLIEQDADYKGSVLILEIKDMMEATIERELVEGRSVNLRGVFEDAWNELVVIEEPIDMESKGCNMW